VIKSGSRQFHAAAWEFDRNDAFDARNYFNAAPAKIAELRFDTYGFNGSGPVEFKPSDNPKTFFFYNMEWRSLVQGGSYNQTVPLSSTYGGNFGTTTIKVPTAAQLSPAQQARFASDGLVLGAPFPNNTIPTNLLDPNAQALLTAGIFPAPTNGAQFQGTPASPTTVREEIGRLDPSARASASPMTSPARARPSSAANLASCMSASRGNDMYDSGANIPFSESVNFNNVLLDNPKTNIQSGQTINPAITVASITGMSSGQYQLPVSNQYSLGIQQSLGANSVLSVSYVRNQKPPSELLSGGQSPEPQPPACHPSRYRRSLQPVGSVSGVQRHPTGGKRSQLALQLAASRATRPRCERLDPADRLYLCQGH
jgi:hypothetical protein